MLRIATNLQRLDVSLSGTSPSTQQQWKDIDFSNLLIDIKRSIFLGVVGKGKSETSRQSIPFSLNVAADLWLWKESTAYPDPNDWVFASPRTEVNDR